MTAKEYLNHAFWIDVGIGSKLDQLERLNALATRATAVFSDTPVDRTRNVHKTEEVILDIIMLEDDIKQDIARLAKEKKEIVDAINSVEGKELRTVLEKRYLCFLPWEEVAADTHYSIQHVFRLHGQALKQIDEYLKMRVHERE